MSNYVEDGRPILENSLVVYLDILGSSNMAQSRESQAYLDKVHKALAFAREFGLHNKEGSLSYISYSFTSFTDHLAVGCPIDPASDWELDVLTMEAALYQFALALEGLFARGALTVGDVCFSEEFAFGPALVEAYEIESKVARHPRIVLSQKAVDFVRTLKSTLDDNGQSGYDDAYLIDHEGSVFINYLYAAEFVATDPTEMIRAHMEAVNRELAEHASDSAVLEKYEWLANYHNYWCRQKYPKLSQYLVEIPPRRYDFQAVK